MKKLKKLKTKLRYSRETPLVFASLGNRSKADGAMTLHEYKIMFKTLLITIGIQSALIILYYILSR